jgi:hypothetical protein
VLREAESAPQRPSSGESAVEESAGELDGATTLSRLDPPAVSPASGAGLEDVF